MQDPAFGTGEPRRPQGAGDRRGGHGRGRAEPDDQDRQAVGQVQTRGLQRRPRVRPLRQGLRELPQIPFPGLFPLRPGPRAGQALQRQGAGIQDHFDGSVAGDARHDQGDDRAAADRGGDRSVHSRPDGEGPRVEGRHAAAPERLRPRSAGLAAPLLEKPQGEPLAISGRIFGRQQHPLLNRISIL